MKWVILLAGMLLFGADSEMASKVRKLVEYNFKLNGLNEIKAPVKIPPKKEKNDIYIVKKKSENRISLRLKVYLVMNNSVYLSYSEIVNGEVKKHLNKWVKVGEKIGWCRLNKISMPLVEFNCNNKKMLIKLVDKNIEVKD